VKFAEEQEAVAAEGNRPRSRRFFPLSDMARRRYHTRSEQKRNLLREIPKKMRVKALVVALSQKMRDGQVVFVDSFALDIPKTAAAKKTLIALSKVKGMERLATKPKNARTHRFFRSYRSRYQELPQSR